MFHHRNILREPKKFMNLNTRAKISKVDRNFKKKENKKTYEASDQLWWKVEQSSSKCMLSFFSPFILIEIKSIGLYWVGTIFSSSSTQNNDGNVELEP